MRCGMRGVPGGISVTWLVVVAATLAGCAPGSTGDATAGGPSEPATTASSPGPDTGASETPATTAPPESATPPEAPSPSPPVGSGELLTVTDHRKTVTMRVGDSRSLRLTRPWVWETPSATGDAVQIAPVNYLVDPGYQEWVIYAVKPGEARIRVFGDAQCPKGAQCLIGDKVLELTVRVS